MPIVIPGRRSGVSRTIPEPPIGLSTPEKKSDELLPQSQSQPQIQFTTPPQPWPSAFPQLPNETYLNHLNHQIPTSVKSILSQSQSPYQFHFPPLSQAPPAAAHQLNQWMSAFPRPSQPNLGPITAEDQGPASLPASKRRKVKDPNVQVISLLSDDDKYPATTTAVTTKSTSTKRKRSEKSRPAPRNGPIPVPEHSSMDKFGFMKDTSKRVVEPQSIIAPVTPADSVRATKALAKSTIKRSSMAPVVRPSSPQRGDDLPSSSPFSSSYAALPSRTNPSNYEMDAFGFRTGSQFMSPPPSSDADSLPSSQQMPPAVVNPVEPPLCPEQAHLVDLIASGKNVFYTGSAGCGKSTVLKAFTRRLRDMGKNVRILAPTGRAALGVNGSTTWTYAGWTPDHHKRTLDELKEAAHGRFIHKRFNETDVLVIDEISMVENLHLQRLNEVMKEARRKPNRGPPPAFGGVQVVVTGDFCQLPPVRAFQHCIECGFELVEKNTATGKVHVCRRHGEYRDEDKWAFRSKAWEECNFVHVHLNTIHRQSDETFIRILQKCRIGRQLSYADTDLLMDHKCMVHHATRLFATREEVANVNRREFERLKTMNHTYWCLDDFFWQQGRHPHLGWKGMRKPKGPQSEGPLRALDDHRFDECVQLKKGMLVVLLVNLDLDSGLCNGSQGIICGFENNDLKKLPQAKTGNKEPENMIFGERAVLKEQQIRKFILDPGAKYKTWPIVRFHNGQIRTIYADCSITELGDERPYSLLLRTQIPLAPAWAMTIHKSQSLTLDRVIVNLSRAFEEGQVYVALSRATGLQGLKIEGDAKGLLAGLGGNREVQEFLREKFGDLNGVSSSQS